MAESPMHMAEEGMELVGGSYGVEAGPKCKTSSTLSSELVLHFQEAESIIPASTLRTLLNAVLPETQTASASSTAEMPYRIIGNQIMGRGLISSTGRSTNPPVENCLHPTHLIEARGNGKNKWWTCKSCGCR
eukprot:3526627-Amphidinium_carterae.1